ncbi:5-(carboxyamino)imidazole ribonucleotide synthase [Geosporobacter ferrireducens]|uniref:N5-carboxyaminoimidazole ribonucleotide synthase n=1 Tax=Geosporobacter ferrireducens TaxID=1424294 RepID=A0A1D8GG79_9FIRM|nr:5-(carboxyamino)imidazole ribonucleotide synthase [Geosporobacter ferrireducens]AOT69895.1 5-(carboxyamino)imidazole ribonucleotide synthase [Geosporobacter ferrireducens]MTI54409.1 5-(carboxyamino)imidazole ribonucleotide synthase [Geosporobacter ferrireducens]
MIPAGDLGKRIGIIGGGQLGKMMLQEAKKMGIYVTILDPVPYCPAHSLADDHIVADFHDEGGLRQLAEKSDVITYEFEHIGVEILQRLEQEGHAIYPTVKSLEIIQNKYLQKQALLNARLPVPEFQPLQEECDLWKLGDTLGYPFLLKSCTGGYDGKGNALVRGPQDLESAYRSLGAGKMPLMAEAFVAFDKEISVLACRGISGEIAVYPVGENFHQDNILIETRVPAALPAAVTQKVLELAQLVMEVFEGVGMFCVEMFVTENGSILINEVAPRPHNSGHYSIEGCVTSQFEQHIRAILGLPLGDTTLIRPTVMRNLLGEEGYAGKISVAGVYEALALPGVKLHIYGKRETKPKRKMGHITVTAAAMEEAVRIIEAAAEQIKIQSGEEDVQ